jgi:Na+/H+ antiporter NhaD/arsenite permease-like protein
MSGSAHHLLFWLIFAITYLGIALGRLPRLVLDRTGIALVGAIAMLLAGGLSIEQAAGYVDYETLLLLFGLMIFSAQLRVAGFYSRMGGLLIRLTSRPKVLLGAVITMSAVLSALLANDIVCLAFTPLLCEATIKARRNPIPYLLALAMASNVGSAATIIGNPQNMYIGTVAGLPFGHYTLLMLPVTIVALMLCHGMIVLICGQMLRETHFGTASTPREMDPSSPEAVPRFNGYVIGKTLALLALLVGYFLFARGPSAAQHRAIAALAGAGILLCSRKAMAAGLYQRVDWGLILLFLGLFVVNGAMRQQQLTDQLFHAVQRTGVKLEQPGPLTAVTLVLSNLVSNVPAVLLLQPSVNIAAQQAHSNQLWYLLALISTWAGNLTLVGSIANLIVAQSAAGFGVKLDLKTYCKVGIPLTILTCAIGAGWLIVMM